MDNYNNGLHKSGSSTLSDLKGSAQNAAQQFGQLSRNVGESVGSAAADLADSASGYLKTGRAYVKENPAKGVAYAAAAGLITGGLLTAVMRRRSA